MRLVRHVTYMEDRRGAFRVLVGRTEGRRPLGRPRNRREVNTKMDHQELRRGHGLDWPTQDRDRWRALVNSVMNTRIPLNVGNSSTSRGSPSLSRRTLLHGVSECMSVSHTPFTNVAQGRKTQPGRPQSEDACSNILCFLHQLVYNVRTVFGRQWPEFGHT